MFLWALRLSNLIDHQARKYKNREVKNFKIFVIVIVKKLSSYNQFCYNLCIDIKIPTQFVKKYILHFTYSMKQSPSWEADKF